MTTLPTISFASLTATPQSTLALFMGADQSLAPAPDALDKKSGGAIRKAAQAIEFKGKAKSSFELLLPPKIDAQRLVVVGAGTETAKMMAQGEMPALGGALFAAINARTTPKASVLVDLPGLDAETAAGVAADLAFGALLRAYAFKKYMTKRPKDDEGNQPETPKTGVALHFHVADPKAAEAAFASRRAVAEGVMLARDLVNEPANVLGPVEFAERTKALKSVGCDVEILDEKKLTDLKMGALLGVAQGSARPARVVVMQWNGAKSKRTKPLCFIGKGVVFDTGGISIKPAGGMEDMKGDMGGAACVVGLMHALAARKAPVNAVGLIGLVENMPSATAQRPGDIVTSMSGQTIEVINTDAEGRLVLADVFTYAQRTYKPKLIVDLATLTGAIMVALGKEHAGLFANDDKLAADLIRAGEFTGERVWRMPLAKAYDKQIDSKNADMKNTGGRFGGAITAAHFIGRFVEDDIPWAHLDVAGVAMDSIKGDINQSWGSGWGVRLLDRFTEDHE
jgi:leucyl aminopeptidase